MWPLANCVKYAVAGTKTGCCTCAGGWLTAGTHRAEPYRQCPGLSRDVVLYPTGRALSAWVGYSVLGAVLDPTGKIVERFTLKWRRLAKNALLMSHRRLTLRALASVNR